MAREIVLDTETTGLDPRTGHRLIEIACIEVEDYLPTGRHYHRYVDPQRDVDPEAEKVHGISRSFLHGKPRFEELCDEFLDFVGDAPVVALGLHLRPGAEPLPGHVQLARRAL
jgi:DNA polymerase-3 subunit epsilon